MARPPIPATTIKTDGEAGAVLGPTREPTVFCGFDGQVWAARVAAAAPRYGHRCPQCNKRTGFEP